MNDDILKSIFVLFICFIGLGVSSLYLTFNLMEEKEKYNKLKDEYNTLEIQYKRDLEDCQTMFGDYKIK